MVAATMTLTGSSGPSAIRAWPGRGAPPATRRHASASAESPAVAAGVSPDRGHHTRSKVGVLAAWAPCPESASDFSSVSPSLMRSSTWRLALRTACVR